MRANVVLPSPLRPTSATFCPRSIVNVAPEKTCFAPKLMPASFASTTIWPERGAGGNLMFSALVSSSSISMRSIFSSCLMRDWTWFDLVGL